MDETEVGQIEAWVGLDVGKQDHHATVVSAAGEALFERSVANDEAAIERLLELAGEGGRCALVIDQPGSIGSLAVLVARRLGMPVAYVPGLVMRRASELYPGEAKTDRRDSFVLADTARTHARRLHWLEVGDETLERLRVLGGYDDDLAHDVNRAAGRGRLPRAGVRRRPRLRLRRDAEPPDGQRRRWSRVDRACTSCAHLDLAIDPGDEDHVVVATEVGLLESENAGEDWQPVSRELAGLLAWPFEDRLHLVDTTGAVQTSEDGGQSRQPAGSIAGQPVAFIAHEGDLYAALGDGSVKASADGGESWAVRAAP